jgi:hypothetical protein
MELGITGRRAAVAAAGFVTGAAIPVDGGAYTGLM